MTYIDPLEAEEPAKKQTVDPLDILNPPMDQFDIEKNKIWAIVSYLSIIGILAVLLADAKNSPFVKFHLNQAIPLAIASFAASAIFGLLPGIGQPIATILGVALVVLAIIGILNAAEGETKRLPVVGNFDDIIK